MRRSFTSLLSAAGIVVFTSIAAHATPLGLSTDPAGASWDRNDANTGFALWDAFPNPSSPGNARIDFTNDGPDSSFGISTPLLSQPTAATVLVQGVGMYDVVQGTPSTGTTGDVLFGGNNTVNFTLNGSALFPIHGVILQVKRAGSTGGFGAGYFDPRLTITGGTGVTSIAADAVVTTSGSGDTSSDGGTYSVTSFYWGASLAAVTGNSTFTINIDKTAFQRSLDAFALDVGSTTVVPEPATGALLIAGICLSAGMRRRRQGTPAAA